MKTHKFPLHHIQLLLQVMLVLALTAAFFLSIYQYDNKYTARSPQAKSGRLILTRQSLEAAPVMFLINGWEYYGGRLLTPDDFKDQPPVPDQYVFIGEFGGFEKWNNGAPHGSASYRLVIQLPEETDTYLLELPEIFSAYRLYVNRVQAAQMGEPEPEYYQPQTGNRLVSIEASGTIELLFAVSDYSHLYSGMVYPPAFGRPDAVTQLLNLRLIIRSLLCAAAVTIGLLSVMVGVLARPNLPALLFGFLCLAFVGYAGYPLFRTLLTDFWFLYLAEHVSFCAMLCIAMLIAARNSGVSKMWGRLFVTFGGLMCVITVILHQLLPLGHLDVMLVYSRLISAYQWITALFIAVTIGLAIKRGTAHLTPLLYGAVIFACALGMDRLLPLHEPVITGWFIELASFALIICAGIVTAYDVAFRYREHSVMQERTVNMEQLYQSQLSYYQTLKQEIEQTKTIRHDMRHHLAVMDRYVKEKQYDRLEIYLGEHHHAVDMAKLPDYCPISVINILTHHYHVIAAKHQIRLEIRSNLKEMSDPGYTAMADSDLCCLYSNLMENAVEACQRVNTGQTIIRVAIFRIAPDILNIHICNTAEQVRQKNGRFLSSKKDGRSGYGLLSVESIVKKYHGSVEFCWKAGEKEFECKVMVMG